MKRQQSFTPSHESGLSHVASLNISAFTQAAWNSPSAMLTIDAVSRLARNASDRQATIKPIDDRSRGLFAKTAIDTISMSVSLYHLITVINLRGHKMAFCAVPKGKMIANRCVITGRATHVTNVDIARCEIFLALYGLHVSLICYFQRIRGVSSTKNAE